MKVGPRNAMVIAVCSLALAVDEERDELRAAYGSAGPVVDLVTAPVAERAGFAELVAAAASPIDDVRGIGRLPSPRPARADGARPGPVRRMRIALTVNGEEHEADVWAGESLLYVLRERLGLPGSKNACEQGECGSCSVLLDGDARLRLPRARRAGGRARGRHGRGARPRRRAPSRAAGLRVGRRRAVRLLHARVRRGRRRPARPRPEPERRRGARGALRQLCRCTGYAKILDAVHSAADRR